MIQSNTQHATLPVSIRHAVFSSQCGLDEYQIMLVPTRYADFETQLAWIEQAYHSCLQELFLDTSSAMIRRFYCSDLQNQSPLLAQRAIATNDGHMSDCAVSWIEQPPCGEARVALWAYHIAGHKESTLKTVTHNRLSLQTGPLTHTWDVNLTGPDALGSERQTEQIFNTYVSVLAERGMQLSEHVLRTWIYVKDVDNNYQGMVEARNRIFDQEGLTQDTHYIASTGIEGGSNAPSNLVKMDAYSIRGVLPEQIEHLSALDYLSPTQLYGVAFERASSVAYADRKHIFISGTASIDWQGKIVHPGDIGKQLQRTLTNIAALLAQANASLSDMSVFIAYVRDQTDMPFIQRELESRFPCTPLVVLKAPVCRPGWLVEIEGIACIAQAAPSLPRF